MVDARQAACHYMLAIRTSMQDDKLFHLMTTLLRGQKVIYRFDLVYEKRVQGSVKVY